MPIRIDRGLRDGETFTWRGRELRCVSTVGNSPGAMSFVLGSGERTVVLSGDVMLDGAKMHTWYDTEWDYGFAAGLQALRKTVCL